MSSDLDHARRVKNRYEDDLMSLDFVQGVGIRQDDDVPSIAVYVDVAAHTRPSEIPERLDDVPVVVEYSGGFHALQRGGTPSR